MSNSHFRLFSNYELKSAVLGLCLIYSFFSFFAVLQAHPANCICIEFDPTGKYFAVGSADALVSLWDVNELACVRTFSFLEWPVRTISFSHDGKLISMASVRIKYLILK